MKLKIKQIRSETQDSFSLVLEKPDNFTFYAGQYLDIKLPVGDPNGNSRAFTIASSPTEEFLMVTPKRGISLFKKLMENLKAGDSVESSHPVGTFILDEGVAAVFIAGGIGITPFRSMIKWAVDQKLTTPMILIYSNSNDDFIFKEELDQWQKELSTLTIHYIVTSQDGRLDKTKLHTIVYKSVNNTIFYLAGSHSFVNNMERILLDLKQNQTNIRYDRFDGYI